MKAFSGSRRPRRLTAAVVAVALLVLGGAVAYAATAQPAIQTSTPNSEKQVTNIDVLRQQDIVGNFGDQLSDLDGGFADRTFKLPNPDYFLPLVGLLTGRGSRPGPSLPRSAKLREALGDDVGVRQIGIRALVRELANGCGERRAERRRLESFDVGTCEARECLVGKVVVAACLHGGQPLAEAGKRECVIAHGADVMLGLPNSTTLDAGARVERVNGAPPKEVVRD
jgi:hypothetical protein